MKHIGIVNITTVGACICANEIVAESIRLGLGDNHPEFTLHAFPFEKYKTSVLAQDWNTTAKIILESITKLQQSGAEFIIIPANTPHYCFDQIKEKSPLPILNIIELTVNECIRRNFKKVGVLGTKLTMQGGLFNSKLEKSGIQAVIPNNEICDRIQSLIFDEILSFKIKPESVQKVAQDIKNLNCDAVILGCTELPEVYSESSLGVSAIDTTRLLAQKAVEYAMGNI